MFRHVLLTAALGAAACGLAACALPAAVPLAGAALGAADVTAFHGCIGVVMSNGMPWNLNNPYACVPQRYVAPGAPQGLAQILKAAP